MLSVLNKRLDILYKQYQRIILRIILQTYIIIVYTIVVYNNNRSQSQKPSILREQVILQLLCKVIYIYRAIVNQYIIQIAIYSVGQEYTLLQRLLQFLSKLYKITKQRLPIFSIISIFTSSRLIYKDKYINIVVRDLPII